MRFDDYVLMAVKAYRENPGTRYGQALVNTLHNVRPDLMEQIQGTDRDPFYVESGYRVIASFLSWVGTHWDEGQS